MEDFFMKIMKTQTFAPQKHKFGIGITCPNQGPAPGAEKRVHFGENGQFSPKMTNFK